MEDSLSSTLRAPQLTPRAGTQYKREYVDVKLEKTAEDQRDM